MHHPDDVSSPAMRSRYLLVVVVEIVVLAGLWALGLLYS
jgi:hypothetical protein